MFLINPYILQASGNPLWDGLLAYYTADNTPNDALGTYNGTLTNGATYGTGIINQGFSLDGVNDYVDIGNNLDFDGTAAFSFSFWAKASSINRLQVPISKQVAATAQGYFIRVESNNKVRFFLGANALGNALYVETTNAIFTTTTNFYHITITYNGSRNVSGLNIYVDGSLQTFTTIQNALSLSTSNINSFAIGSQYTTAQYFAGIIDEVGVFNKELSSSEVTELYNSGAAKQYPN